MKILNLNEFLEEHMLTLIWGALLFYESICRCHVSYSGPWQLGNKGQLCGQFRLAMSPIKTGLIRSKLAF